MSNEDISPAFVHPGTEAELQAEIDRVFKIVGELLWRGDLPRTGASVIAIVNVAAYLLAHSPLPADPRAWQRMCMSAFHKFQGLYGRTDQPKDDQQQLLNNAIHEAGVLTSRGQNIAATIMLRLVDDVIRLQGEKS